MTRQGGAYLNIFHFAFTQVNISTNFNTQVCLSLSGDDITSIQQEITMMKECKHKNIVAYLGTYHRCVPPFLVAFILLCLDSF